MKLCSQTRACWTGSAAAWGSIESRAAEPSWRLLNMVVKTTWLACFQTSFLRWRVARTSKKDATSESNFRTVWHTWSAVQDGEDGSSHLLTKRNHEFQGLGLHHQVMNNPCIFLPNPRNIMNNSGKKHTNRVKNGTAAAKTPKLILYVLWFLMIFGYPLIPPHAHARHP